MKKILSVDIVFINRNTSELLIKALKTIKELSKLKTRVIIIDNGSTQSSIDLLYQEIPEARIVEMNCNAGFARAVNTGLNLVASKYVFVLNTDIEFVNDVCSILVKALENDESAILACPKLIRPDGSLQAAVVPYPSLFTELTNRSLAQKKLNTDPSKTSYATTVVGPCMVFKIAELRKVGFFDENFFFFFEETDLCKRINQYGGKILYVPNAELIHLQGKAANTTPYRARIQFYESRYLYFKKHFGIFIVLLLYLGLFLRLTVNVLGTFFLSLVLIHKSKVRKKLSVYIVILFWHILLCKPKWGFLK